MADELIYVIADYTTGDKQKKIENVSKFCMKLLEEGQVAFAPGVYINAIKNHKYKKPLTKDPEKWKDYFETFISCCDRVIVVNHKGFEQSKILKDQIKIAQGYEDIIIEYVKIDDL